LWNWRRQVQCGQLMPEPMPTFLPVQVVAEMKPAGLAPAASSGRDLRVTAPTGAERIEIALPDGTCIRVGADVGLATLRRVMAAVRR
jgi:transposase